MTDRLGEYRERLLAGVNEHLDDGEEATTAVLVQRRARWALPLGIVAALLVSGLLGEGNALVRGGLIGLSIAGVLMYGTTFFTLARTDRGLVLARTSKWSQNRVQEIADRMPADTSIEHKPGIMTDRLKIGDQSYLMNRQFRIVLQDMIGGDTPRS